MNLDEQLRQELDDLECQDRLRFTRTLLGANRVHPSTRDGQPLLSFCTNDYLGLSNHPALAEAASRATADLGFGACASRLVSGETPAHVALEAALASHLDQPAALLFPTGYQANMGVLTALAGPDDLIVSDASNHASIVDGCRLSRARIVVYAHGNPSAARSGLATAGHFRRRLLVTESLFSMDGDRAPLQDLARVASLHDAVFIVDEAHALGVVGPQGRGLAAESGVLPHVTVGTLGKAFAALGGFAAGSHFLRDVLTNRARQFIYTTACPPAIAAAAQAALTYATSVEGSALRDRALDLASQLRDGLKRLHIPAPGQDLIVPVILGGDRQALHASATLLDQGILVPAIRPPTVSPGTARLRITISAAHTPGDVARLLAALAALSPKPPPSTPKC